MKITIPAAYPSGPPPALDAHAAIIGIRSGWIERQAAKTKARPPRGKRKTVQKSLQQFISGENSKPDLASDMKSKSPMWLLRSELAEAAGCREPSKVYRLVASGQFPSDGITLKGRPIFKFDRLAELKTLLTKPEIVA